MKPSLQLKLSQHLTLTPQLQQSIKLLQLSTIELNQEIERVLLENPMLEREDGDGGEYAPPPPGSGPEREAATEPAADGLALLLKLVARGTLKPVIGKEADWTDVATVARDLIDRTFAGKAVLHVTSNA